jgi:hypothetical protein
MTRHNLMSTMRRLIHRSNWRLAALGAAGCLLFFTTPAFASGGAYWAGFKKYWRDFFGNPSGVVVTVIIVGIICLLIITRVTGNKA